MCADANRRGGSRRAAGLKGPWALAVQLSVRDVSPTKGGLQNTQVLRHNSRMATDKFDEVARFAWHGLLGSPTLKATDREWAIRETAALLRERCGNARLPVQGETVAVATQNPKTAALLFDRIWSPPRIDTPIPDEVQYYGASFAELLLQTALMSQTFMDQVRERAPTLSEQEKRDNSAASTRMLAEAITLETGVHAVPLYQSRYDRGKEYIAGDRVAVHTVLTNVRVADEAALSWEQVLEFRRDADMARKYRRLLQWFDVDMTGKSLGAIEDAVVQQLEEYEQALHKHGIATTLGALESLLDPKFVAGASALMAGLAFARDLPTAALMTTSLAIGRFACTIGRGLFDLQNDQKRFASTSPIAFVHELRSYSGDAG
jgi:hypothetical protein